MDELVKEQIELYLMYSSKKTLSVNDYIKIRKQAVKEYALNIKAEEIIKKESKERTENKNNSGDEKNTTTHTKLAVINGARESKKENLETSDKELTEQDILKMLTNVEE